MAELFGKESEAPTGSMIGLLVIRVMKPLIYNIIHPPILGGKYISNEMVHNKKNCDKMRTSISS